MCCLLSVSQSSIHCSEQYHPSCYTTISTTNICNNTICFTYSLDSTSHTTTVDMSSTSHNKHVASDAASEVTLLDTSGASTYSKSGTSTITRLLQCQDTNLGYRNSFRRRPGSKNQCQGVIREAPKSQGQQPLGQNTTLHGQQGGSVQELGGSVR